MIVVAKDGTGDYTSLQEAIDAIPPAAGRSPALVLIRAGEYRERVVVHKDHVRLLGEDPERTAVVWNGCANDQYEDGTVKGTFLSATLTVTGRNVEVENLTVRNDAGDGRLVGQAVAVYAAGDRGVWRNCRLIACQDTLFCGPVRLPNTLEELGERRGHAEEHIRVEGGPLTSSRQYFENCLIRGDVDFIFGSYRCWFEGCTLFMNSRGGYYTAANTNRDQPFGFVFHRCLLTGECEAGAGYLGRPWRKYARTLFLECEMDGHVAPEGFCDWDADRVVTDRYGEWRTAGARADQSSRHPSQKRLTDDEAALVTLAEVLGGPDHWRPDRRVPSWFLCGTPDSADTPAERALASEWEQALEPLLTEDVYIQREGDRASSGREIPEEERLERLALCLRKGDRLLLSFSRPETRDRYAETARNQGAEPVLLPELLKEKEPMPDAGAVRIAGLILSLISSSK